ncbi:MAG: hypothetical protein RLZZ124_1224 [Cyanobacteriota bacterium]
MLGLRRSLPLPTPFSRPRSLARSRPVSLPLLLLVLATGLEGAIEPPLARAEASAARRRPAAIAATTAAAADPLLRVLLHEGAAQTLSVSGAAGLRVRDRQGRLLQDIPGFQPLRIRASGSWVELAPPGPEPASTPPASPPAPVPLVGRGTEGSPFDRSPARPSERIAGPELWLEPLPPGGEQAGLVLQQRRFRGRLQLLARSGGLQVINHVPLETYLASVVGSEMPASWPQQALRAQAVAARTYALKGRRPSAPFDLRATVASQVYRGIEAETASTRSAVAATRGLVLTYGNGLIDAVFHSSSGGSTESSGDLWPRQLPYLVSVPDFDHDSPVRSWRQPLAPDLLARAFREIGGMRSIEVLSTTGTGRVRQARVVGPTGELVLSGAALRSRLGLRSTWVRFELELADGLAAMGGIAQPAPPAEGAPASAHSLLGVLLPPLPAFSLPAAGLDPAAPLAPGPSLPLPQWVAVGRGFGHGIGMSQWGAFTMARRGDRFDTILSHYYRGARVRPVSQLAAVAAAASGSTGAQARDGDVEVVATGPRRSQSR